MLAYTNIEKCPAKYLTTKQHRIQVANYLNKAIIAV